MQEKERLTQVRRKEERRQQAAGDTQYKAQAWTEISHDVIEDLIVCIVPTCQVLMGFSQARTSYKYFRFARLPLFIACSSALCLQQCHCGCLMQDDEFGTDSSLENSDEEIAEDDPLYCVVCDRRFRTETAYVWRPSP